MITRKGLADEIDQIDEAIKAYNDSKRDAFDAYRDQMIAAGVAKANVKAEIEAVKAAIKRRRAAVKDKDALIEKDELIDEVFEEITRAPRAHVENIEKFDPTTGEIIEADVRAKLVETIAAGVQTEVGRKALIAAVDIMIAREEQQENAAASQGEAEVPSDVRETDREAADTLAGANAGGEDVDDNTAANVKEADAPLNTSASAFTDKPKYLLRPHCLNPGENCGGYGDKHCHACTVAMRKREQAEEVA
jgi:hypothetical protein